MARPQVGGALALGLAAALGTATAIALLAAILSMTAGLLAVAVLGGWLIGLGVQQGAWAGRPHRLSRLPEALGAGMGLGAWAGGLVGAWLVSMAILPGSVRTFPERLAAIPFLDWLGPQLTLLELAELAILVGVAWAASRSPGVEERAGA